MRDTVDHAQRDARRLEASEKESGRADWDRDGVVGRCPVADPRPVRRGGLGEGRQEVLVLHLQAGGSVRRVLHQRLGGGPLPVPPHLRGEVPHAEPPPRAVGRRELLGAPHKQPVPPGGRVGPVRVAGAGRGLPDAPVRRVHGGDAGRQDDGDTRRDRLGCVGREGRGGGPTRAKQGEKEATACVLKETFARLQRRAGHMSE